ncbi:MAG: hypothetical protein ACOH1J_02640 [Microbacteriaceae bacterium]
MAFPLFKEENQLKENQSSSSVGDAHESATGLAEDDDASVADGSDEGAAVFARLLDAGIEMSLQALDARLSLSEFRRRLVTAGINPGRVDLPTAAKQSLSVKVAIL